MVLHWVASFTVHSNADISLTCCVQHFTVAVWCSTESLGGPAHAGTEVLSDEDPELSKISSFMSAVGQNMVMWYLPCLELYVTPR